MDYNRYCRITKPSNIIELIEYNKFLLGETSKMHLNWEMMKPEHFISDYEREQSKVAIRKKTTQYSLEEFSYTLNEIGYRSRPTAEFTMGMVGFYGCSFTMGVGLPEKHTFVNLFEKSTGLKCANFGISGAGSNKIMKAFISSTSCLDISTAIFILPSIYRFELFYRTAESLRTQDIAPSNYRPKNAGTYLHYHKEHMERIKSVYALFADEQFADELVRNLEIIVSHCLLRNMQCFFTSWCQHVYQILCEYVNSSWILDFIDLYKLVPEAGDQGLGRDGLHPGPMTHESVAAALSSKFQINVDR